MAVYVDDMIAKFRGMVMCHMIADTRDELDAMADAIGVKRHWIQKAGTKEEHYDICKTKRQKALQLGAIPITQRELVKKIVQKIRDPLDAEHGTKS